jgi:hypothetical protein
MAGSSRNHCITAVVGTLIQISVALWVTVICVDLLTRAPSPADLEAAAEVATLGAAGEQPESIYRRTAYGYVVGTVAFAGSLGLIGLVCNFLIAVMGQYRARWFFWASLLCALIYTVSAPMWCAG